MDSLTIAYGLVACCFCSYLWWLGRQQTALSRRLTRLEEQAATSTERLDRRVA